MSELSSFIRGYFPSRVKGSEYLPESEVAKLSDEDKYAYEHNKATTSSKRVGILYTVASVMALLLTILNYAQVFVFSQLFRTNAVRVENSGHLKGIKELTAEGATTVDGQFYPGMGISPNLSSSLFMTRFDFNNLISTGYLPPNSKAVLDTGGYTGTLDKSRLNLIAPLDSGIVTTMMLTNSLTCWLLSLLCFFAGVFLINNGAFSWNKMILPLFSVFFACLGLADSLGWTASSTMGANLLVMAVLAATLTPMWVLGLGRAVRRMQLFSDLRSAEGLLVQNDKVSSKGSVVDYRQDMTSLSYSDLQNNDAVATKNTYWLQEKKKRLRKEAQPELKVNRLVMFFRSDSPALFLNKNSRFFGLLQPISWLIVSVLVTTVALLLKAPILVMNFLLILSMLISVIVMVTIVNNLRKYKKFNRNIYVKGLSRIDRSILKSRSRVESDTVPETKPETHGSHKSGIEDMQPTD